MRANESTRQRFDVGKLYSLSGLRLGDGVRMVKLLWMTRAEAGHLSRPETKEPRYVSSRAQAGLLTRPLFLFVKQVNSYKSYAIKSFFP